MRQQILDSSKLKEFADDNFRFDANGRKLSKQVENTVGKGEIARYEQFLLFPQCFQKDCFPGASKGVIVWEWVNCVANQIRDTITSICMHCVHSSYTTGNLSYLLLYTVEIQTKIHINPFPHDTF